MEEKRGEPWTVDDVDRLFVLLNQGLRKRDMSFPVPNRKRHTSQTVADYERASTEEGTVYGFT